MSELRYYQTDCVVEVLDKKRIIIGDEMSLGKSAEAIKSKEAIENEKRHDIKTLIVCPTEVMPVWEREIKKWYKKKEKSQIATTHTSTYDDDVRKIKNQDFAIIGYSTLSSIGNDVDEINKLKSKGFEYIIGDEAHNAKNPEAYRTKAVRNLFDSAEYLTLLSGTPIPNTVVDIYMLLHLLDNKSFPIKEGSSKSILRGFYNLFKKNPDFVKNILDQRMIRREIGDCGLDIKFPTLNQKNLEVKLEGEHKEVYLEIYESDISKSEAKLRQLIYASIDPNLVDPSLLNGSSKRIGQMESCVYKALDKLIEEIVDKNGKALIFSDLKTGVTKNLQERFKKYNALLIDGDVLPTKNFNKDIKLREEIRRRFQQDPDNKLLISTTVMNEGVDLSAATTTIHLTLPYVPGAFDQRNRRGGRIGEVSKESMDIYVVKPYIDHLIPVITEGMINYLDDKRRIINYLITQPNLLTEADLKEIKEEKPRNSKWLVPPSKSPSQMITKHFKDLRGKGGLKIRKDYIKDPTSAKSIAGIYASYWEGYYGGNTATLLKKVINTIEQHEILEDKLDVASGPFSLSRVLRQPLVNLDLNYNMPDAGKILENEGKIVAGNKAIQGYFHELPFKSNSFDLAVCSLALHLSSLNQLKNSKQNEREAVLREMNRVLKKDKYGFISLPYTVIGESNLPKFYANLEKLGFKVLPFSGFYKAVQEAKYKFFYITGLKKMSEPCEENLGDDAFRWDMDYEIKRRKNMKEKRNLYSEEKTTKKEVVSDFYYAKNKKSVEEIVMESIKI